MKHSHAYYIRNGYGLRPIRSRREAKALYRFCKDQLVSAGKSWLTANPDIREVFENTIALYVTEFELGNMTASCKCHCPRCKYSQHTYSDFLDYVEDHCGWYWN